MARNNYFYHQRQIINDSLLVLSNSCGFLDQYFVTVPHIVKRDHVYDMIVRNVQRMTNFARYG